MNPRKAQNILAITGTGGTTLHKDVVDLENILLSTDQQIESIQEVCCRLKEIRTGVLYHYDENGMDVEEFILTMGNAFLPLAKTIYRLEAKRDGLRLSLDNIHVTVRAANRFANKVPAIPKMD